MPQVTFICRHSYLPLQLPIDAHHPFTEIVHLFSQFHQIMIVSKTQYFVLLRFLPVLSVEVFFVLLPVFLVFVLVPALNLVLKHAVMTTPNMTHKHHYPSLHAPHLRLGAPPPFLLTQLSLLGEIMYTCSKQTATQ